MPAAAETAGAAMSGSGMTWHTILQSCFTFKMSASTFCGLNLDDDVLLFPDPDEIGVIAVARDQRLNIQFGAVHADFAVDQKIIGHD